MVLTIYADYMSQPARAVIMFCKENGIPHEVKQVSIAKGQHRTEEYKQINPVGKIPAIDDDGFRLFESHAIMRYLAETRKVADHWYPVEVKKRALVNAVLDWHHMNLRRGAAGLIAAMYLGPMFKRPAAELEAEAKVATAVLKSSLLFIEKTLLANTPFLFAQEMSIADLSLSQELIMSSLVDVDLSSYPKTRAWLSRCRDNVSSWDEVCKVLNTVLKRSKKTPYLESKL